MPHFLSQQLRDEIMRHESNAALTALGYVPLFSASPTAKIVIIGQAPGIKAQMSGKVWDDASGHRLMQWLGVSEDLFRNPAMIAHIPMDFYYPGKGRSGDLPPRKEFAALWHARILHRMPDVKMTILIGRYAQQYYLRNAKSRNLTDTVRNYTEYLPDYFPIVHPSPLNFRWLQRNRWFEDDVVSELQTHIKRIVALPKENVTLPD